MDRYICIHGHFYQPPRENPWLEEIELQDSAAPYHDWNERIKEECYAPNAASRILDSDGKIIEITNNYSKMSFNFGPTLLSWMERKSPEVYQAIIKADEKSKEEFSGHGSAIAQAYNHIIMPLANSRDKRTQIIWGIRDFEHRFKRKPEGMWLPETAVDLETLDILAEHGIKFTILAPRQAKRERKRGEEEWKDVTGEKVDHRRSYLCKLPSGRTINIFFYDGQIAEEVGFGDLLKNGERFAKKLMEGFTGNIEPQIVNIATDGETYGHHHHHADMALAYCLHYMESKEDVEINVYGQYLENNPPTHEIEIIEETSWSCIHGIERWRNDCGCNTGNHPDWNQEWRAPLREAMNWLRDKVIPIYEDQMGDLVSNPWQARDEYIEIILDRSDQSVENFLSKHSKKKLSRGERVKMLKLLEMQRHAMLMFTSCGWFFDELSARGGVQVMRYAARVMQLAEELSGKDLEPEYRKILQRAPSNVPDYRDGAEVYDSLVKSSVVDFKRVGANYALNSLFKEYSETGELYCYTYNTRMYDLTKAGHRKLATGEVHLQSDITEEEENMYFMAVYAGGQDLLGGIREEISDDLFFSMNQEIKKVFESGEITKIVHTIDKYFEEHNYSLKHLFRDEKRAILNQIIEGRLKEIGSIFRQIYDQNYGVMRALRNMGMPLPRSFTTAAEVTLNKEIQDLLRKDESNLDQLQDRIEEMEKWSLEVNKDTLFSARQKIDKLMEELSQSPRNVYSLERVESTLKILSTIPKRMHTWKSQNIYFFVGKELQGEMQEKAEKGDKKAERWVEKFKALGEHLKVKIPGS
ncbi:MAG: DUF3536 domain-containing protein [Thermoproteota archaeon]